jgi:hypothetical protein
MVDQFDPERNHPVEFPECPDGKDYLPSTVQHAMDNRSHIQVMSSAGQTIVEGGLHLTMPPWQNTYRFTDRYLLIMFESSSVPDGQALFNLIPAMENWPAVPTRPGSPN